MSEHTREPWHVFVSSAGKYPGIDSPDCSVVIWGKECGDDGGVRGRTVGQARANAERICTCVNALAGIPGAALDSPAFLRAVESFRETEQP